MQTWCGPCQQSNIYSVVTSARTFPFRVYYQNRVCNPRTCKNIDQPGIPLVKIRNLILLSSATKMCVCVCAYANNKNSTQLYAQQFLRGDLVDQKSVLSENPMKNVRSRQMDPFSSNIENDCEMLNGACAVLFALTSNTDSNESTLSMQQKAYTRLFSFKKKLGQWCLNKVRWKRSSKMQSQLSSLYYLSKTKGAINCFSHFIGFELLKRSNKIGI